MRAKARSRIAPENSFAATAAAVILIALVAGLSVSLWQYRKAERERAKAETVSGFLQKIIASSDPFGKSTGKKGRGLSFNEALDEAARRLDAEDWSAQPEVKAELQMVIGSNYLAQGQYETAEKLLRPSLAAQTEIYGANSRELLRVQTLLANLLLAKADYDGAGKIYEQYLPALEDEYRNDKIESPALISVFNNYALLKRARGDSAQAETLLRAGLALVEDSSPQKQFDAREEIKINRTFLALILLDRGEFGEVETIAHGLVEDYRQTAAGDSPSLANALTLLGSIQMEKGDAASAENNLREAETLYRKIYEPNYIGIYDNLRLQAQTLYLSGNYAEAETKIDQVLENYRRNSNPKYINFATALTVRGLVLNRLGKSAEAETVLREALNLRRENLPENHFMTALTAGAPGEVLTAERKFDEAEPLLRESRDRLKSTQATENARTDAAKNRLAALYTNWNKPELLAEVR